MTNPVETPNAVHGCIIMASGLGIWALRVEQAYGEP